MVSPSDKKYKDIFQSILKLEASIKNKDFKRIWVYGSTQAGKSSFINAYMGEKVTQEGNGQESCTRIFSVHEHLESKTVLIDTIGLNDSDGRDVETLRAIGNGCRDIKVSMFLMVLAKGVFDANVQALISNLKYMFCLENRNEKFAVVLSRVDVDDPDNYTTELLDARRITLESFQKKGFGEPANIWPMSTKPLNLENKFDKMRKAVQEERFSTVKREIINMAHANNNEIVIARDLSLSLAEIRREMISTKKILENEIRNYLDRNRDCEKSASRRLWDDIQVRSEALRKDKWYDESNYQKELITQTSKGQSVGENIKQDIEGIYSEISQEMDRKLKLYMQAFKTQIEAVKANFDGINGPDQLMNHVGDAYMIGYAGGGALYAGGLVFGVASGGSVFIVAGLVAAGMAAGGALKIIANSKWQYADVDNRVYTNVSDQFLTNGFKDSVVLKCIQAFDAQFNPAEKMFKDHEDYFSRMSSQKV